MAITQVIAGHYTGTYNAVSVGFTKEGFRLQKDTKAELINQSDAYGESLIDFVHRGGDIRLTFDCRVYAAGATAPFYPWGALGVMFTAAAPIGRLASNVAAAMVLTATAGTPAATSPATLTGSKAILAPNSNLSLLFDSRVRDVPQNLMLLPTETAGTGSWFTTT